MMDFMMIPVVLAIPPHMLSPFFVIVYIFFHFFFFSFASWGLGYFLEDTTTRIFYLL